MSDLEIHFTSSNTSSNRRISPQWTLSYLSQRIETFTGVPPESQQLLHFESALSTDPIDLASQFTPTSLVSQLGLSESSRIQVNDTRPLTELDDLENAEGVEFFELKDEDYDKRQDSVRQWKRENKLGRFNPQLAKSRTEQAQRELLLSTEITVGARFRTVNAADGTGTNERRGKVSYIGPVPEIDSSSSVWIGVTFDEPVGKNDGSIKGQRYFQCGTNYGGFLKPSLVEVGDWPEESLFSESDDEI